MRKNVILALVLGCAVASTRGLFADTCTDGLCAKAQVTALEMDSDDDDDDMSEMLEGSESSDDEDQRRSQLLEALADDSLAEHTSEIGLTIKIKRQDSYNKQTWEAIVAQAAQCIRSFLDPVTPDQESHMMDLLLKTLNKIKVLMDTDDTAHGEIALGLSCSEEFLDKEA